MKNAERDLQQNQKPLWFLLCNFVICYFVWEKKEEILAFLFIYLSEWQEQNVVWRNISNFLLIYSGKGRESKRETFIFRRNYPLSTHIMELFLRISPVCQMTAALLRLNLNFESDLLDDPHLVQQLIITWRKRSSPEVCPRCGSAPRSLPRICSRGTKQRSEPLHSFRLTTFPICCF